MKKHLHLLLVVMASTQVVAQCSKSIKDPVEFNAYISATSTCSGRPFDAARSAASWEEFLRMHPNSAVRNDALEVLLVGYYRLRASDKLIATAERLLEINPNNLSALAVLAYAKRIDVVSVSKPDQNKNDAGSYAQRGRLVIRSLSQDKCTEADARCIVPFAEGIFNAPSKDAAEESLNGMTSLLLLRHCNLRPQF